MHVLCSRLSCNHGQLCMVSVCGKVVEEDDFHNLKKHEVLGRGCQSPRDGNLVSQEENSGGASTGAREKPWWRRH
jgi:hypothetical protein